MNSRSQFVASLGAFSVAFAFAVREMTLLDALDAEGLATAFRAALVVGWLPAFVFGPLIDWLSTRDHGAVRAIGVSVCIVGVGAAALLNPEHALFAVLVAVVCGVGYAALPFMRRPSPTAVRISIVSALLMIAFWLVANIHWAPKDGGEFVDVATSTVILLLVPLGVYAPLVYRVVDDLRVRLVLTVLLWIGAVAAAVYIAGFDFALYVPPKIFVVIALGAAIALDAYEYPSSDDRLAAVVMLVAAAPMLVYLRVAPVPERFGTAPLDTLTGTAVMLASLGDDRDGDGFLAADAGGNDCAPDTKSSVLDIAACLVDVDPSPPRAAPPTFDAPVQHAFVFIVDALRPDAVAGVAELEELARRGVLFTRGYAPGNRTYASFRPMLSGIAEPSFLAAGRADGEAHRRVGDGRGLFALPGIPHNVFLHSALFPDEPDGYLGQDPTVRAETDLHTGAVVQAADAWLDKWKRDGGGRISMALYTRDPHAPYVCEDGRTGGRECYDDEVREVGRGIADFVELLERHEILDESLIVVLGDHGEAFGEHHHFYHASSLYEEQVRVPIFVLHPALSAGRRIDTPVSAMSLVATFADALHAPPRHAPPYRSLLAIAQGATPRPVVMHDLRDHDRPLPPRQSALILGPEKLIYDWNSHRAALFDLDADPGERRDLAADQPARASELVRTLLTEMLVTAGKR